MSRIWDYSSSGKAIASGGTATFTNSDVPSNGVGLFLFGMTGAGNTLANIVRVRFKANNTSFIDVPPKMLRAWLQRLSASNVAYPADKLLDPIIGGGTASDFRRFSVPFYDLEAPTEDLADLFQFPRNSQITIEIQFGAGAGAGSIFAGWMESDQQNPVGFTKLVSAPMNIPASNPNFKYPFVDDGYVKGFGINTLGNLRTRIQIDGVQVFHMQGQAADSATVTADSLLLESNQLNNAIAADAAGTLCVPALTLDPTFLKLSQPRPATAGRSFVEVQTGVSWGTGGTAATNEGCVYSQYIYNEYRGNRVLQKA